MINARAGEWHPTQVPRLQTSDRDLAAELARDGVTQILEAHNGISAKCVSEAGFPVIWASGFSVATSLGLRDCNEASMTEVLSVVEYMADSVATPILVDGDTGFGNFNNVRRLTKKLGRVGARGVCIEDKRFPKMNSFVGDSHDLVDAAEFCGKVAAAVESRPDDGFAVVARTEAFVAGRSLGEALARADAYRCAGADAIVVHSRSSDGADVLAFAREWGRRSALIAIPTTYPGVPLHVLEEAGISAVVWANHLLRAAVSAMRAACASIRSSHSTAQLEASLTPMTCLQAMCDYAEHQSAEARLGAQGQRVSGAGIP